MVPPRFFEPGPAPQQRTEEEAKAEALEALRDQLALINEAAEAAIACAVAGTAPVGPPPRLHLEADSRLYAGCGGVAAAFNHVQMAFACASPELRALVARRELEEGQPASWASGALCCRAREIGLRFFLHEYGGSACVPPKSSHALLTDESPGLFSTSEEALFGLESLSEFERPFSGGAAGGAGDGTDGEVRLRIGARRFLAGIPREDEGGPDAGPDSRVVFFLAARSASWDAEVPHPAAAECANVGLAEGEADVLYGRAGEVATCLELDRILRRFVVDHSPRWEGPSRPVAEARAFGGAREQLADAADALCAFLLRAGRRKFAAAQLDGGAPPPGGDKFGLHFDWHGKNYLGAAHGLCGILHTLASAAAAFGGAGGMPRSRRAGLKRALEWGVDSLLGNTVEATGNLKTAPASERDELVQWCHGSPGLLFLEAALEDMHRDRRGGAAPPRDFVTLGEQPPPPLDLCVSAERAAALRAATTKAVGDIARRGFLTKGLGLCHGMSGNGYALLAYARTRRLARLRGAEEVAASERDAGAALAAARRFRDVIAARWEEFAAVPDKAPAGLYTGLAGAACFLADSVFREGGVCGAMVRVFFLVEVEVFKTKRTLSFFSRSLFFPLDFSLQTIQNRKSTCACPASVSGENKREGGVKMERGNEFFLE